MSLAQEFYQFHDKVTSKVAELINTKLGVKHPDFQNFTVLDLRMFSLRGELDNPYNIELLAENDSRIDFICEQHAYAEDGNRYDLTDIVDASPESLSLMIDTLEKLGYPQYNVLLRAIVEADSVETDEMDDNDFVFPDAWDVYDSTGDEERTIRLDTVVTVSASSKEDAIEKAIENPPSLGLEEYTCDVKYWVDKDQEDNVQLVTE